jgi:hypothetical protein
MKNRSYAKNVVLLYGQAVVYLNDWETSVNILMFNNNF